MSAHLYIWSDFIYNFRAQTGFENIVNKNNENNENPEEIDYIFYTEVVEISEQCNQKEIVENKQEDMENKK